MEISIRSKFFALFLMLCCYQIQDVLGEDFPTFGPRVVSKESRRILVSTESGVITAVDLHDRYTGPHHLQAFTLEPGSLLLPVILHSDMVFYVNTGRGSVNWIAKDGTTTNLIEVRRGDIYRLEEGTVFYVQSYPDTTREKLRIYAVFDTILEENPSEPFLGAYSNITDLVRGFDDEILQMAFGVSDEVIQRIKSVQNTPPIVHYEPKNETDGVDWREGIFEALMGRHPISIENSKKKEKTKTLNLHERQPDVENCNGRSVAVTSKEFKALKGSDIGIFMVNLTRGSMMGPHWNPRATEIAVVTHGQGIVQAVCPSNPPGVGNEDYKCQNTKFKVNEGDVFIIPRYHPMVQVSYNNGSFVFVGFTTTASRNYPQFIAGERSVMRAINREILAISFNTTNTTISALLDSQQESIMLECATCAEQLERKMEEEIERKRQEEEARKREEEEAKRREEEEERKRREEEERKREEEEEEAKRREEEEERKRKEEEARKREEEERREEEEARKREEEEEAAAKRRQEEEEEKARRREEQEEEARRREAEEAARRQHEEEEEARRREEEEEERREEEEATRRKEEEEEARRQHEEEEETRRREKEEARRMEEEEEEARREEEEARREEEEAREQAEAGTRKWEEEMARTQKAEEEEVRRKEDAAVKEVVAENSKMVDNKRNMWVVA